MQADMAQRLFPEWVAAFDGQSLSFVNAEPASLYARSGSVTTLFDGVLWNRGEILESLELPASESDASLLAHAWLRWGERLLDKIKGIFALLVWDRDSDSLFCARDAMGIYPLFYSETGNEVLFSTSVEALLRQPSVPRTLNRVALADHLLERWPDAAETFYQRVRRVLPGHVARFGRAGCRTHRYWDPAPPGRPIDWVPEDELGRFDGLLVEAVRRCLSFGPAAIHLSGGLDSVSVAAVAAEHSALLGLPPPLALSLIFPHPDCNEEPVQRAVAAQLGFPQEIVPFDAPLGPQGWLAAALDLSRRLPAPLLNVWAPAYLNLDGYAQRSGSAAVLTGMGGDEWLAVTPVLAADLIGSADVRGLYNFWRTQRRSFPLPFLAQSRFLLWTSGLRPVLRSAALRVPGGRHLHGAAASVRRLRHPEFPPWLGPDPELRAELRRRSHAAAQSYNAERLQFDSHYAYDVHHSLEQPLACWENEEYFILSGYLGLRILHPYLDAELVDFLYRVPPQLLNRGGRSKGLVRDYLARAFPDLGFDRQKKVISTDFFCTKLLQEAPRAVDGLCRHSALSELGIVDRDLLRSVIELGMKNGRPRDRFLLWTVLNLDTWVRARF